MTQPDGTTRTIRLRCTGDGDRAFPRDPARQGWALYGVSLVAEDPYWEGASVTRTWSVGAAVGYFGAGAGVGPPYHISPGSDVSSAKISNPGDVDAWMRWTIAGPCTAATVGIGARTISVPITLGAGEWIVLDTSPASQVAVDHNGANRTLELGSADWSEIPPGESVALNLSLTGVGGSITGALTPRFLRAW